MTNPRPMKSWGDVNLALNHLVRDGVIEGFRTNRDAKNADPEIALTISPDMKEAAALHAVRSTLTGAFADAVLSVEVAG